MFWEFFHNFVGKGTYECFVLDLEWGHLNMIKTFTHKNIK